MNRFSLYVFLILIFLGFSKSFSPVVHGKLYVVNEKVYPNYFPEEPVTIILLDSFKTGFLIKTYFHKYLKIYAFGEPEELVIKTSKDFWKDNYKNRGLSLYRKEERKHQMNFTPMPPGTLFIHDPSFGNWVKEDSGDQKWKFHRAYKDFPKILGWGKYRPTKTFYNQLQLNLKQNIPFYGSKNEFGEKGVITNRNFPKSNIDKRDKIKFIQHLKDLFKFPSFKG